jgi:hypothetical protein
MESPVVGWYSITVIRYRTSSCTILGPWGTGHASALRRLLATSTCHPHGRLPSQVVARLPRMSRSEQLSQNAFDDPPRSPLLATTSTSTCHPHNQFPSLTVSPHTGVYHPKLQSHNHYRSSPQHETHTKICTGHWHAGQVMNFLGAYLKQLYTAPCAQFFAAWFAVDRTTSHEVDQSKNAPTKPACAQNEAGQHRGIERAT